MPEPTQRLGPYELDAIVGEGGMGDVWKGRDTRLDRSVAIKILRGEVSRRFELEARAVSALSHPNICTLYDIGLDNGTPYLVMEYVDGKPPAGPLPVREVLRYAIQIADALAAAHKAGIVHRDIKPANVLVTRSGTVKLVDFGLAKLESDRAATAETVVAPITREGMLVGTLQYMSPEQLEGREADERSDIFAFGLLLYELITGRRAFDADSQAGIIAVVMRNDPPAISSLAPDTPRALDHIVRRALQKDPLRRWQTMDALKDALEWVAEAPASAPEESTQDRRRLLPLAAGAIALIGATALGVWAFAPATPPERLQVEVALPGELTLSYDSVLSIAPGGRSFVVNANKTLWWRSLEDGTLRALPGTTGATLPFWSPDGTHVAFFADGRLKKMRLPGATPQVLCDAPNPRGGTWGADDTIVFAPKALGSLFRVSANGGTPEPVTQLDRARQEDQHSAPVFLPGGRQFIYHARSLLKENSTLALASVSDAPGVATRAVVPADTGGWYAPPIRRGDGYVLFVRLRNLFMQRFDRVTGQVSGEATVLARRVRVTADAVPNLSVGTDGELLFGADEPRVNQPRWYDRQGSLVASIGDLGDYMAARASPDQQLLATVRSDPEDFGTSMWVLDMARNVDTRITVAGDIDDPVWSPDGERIAFAWFKPGEESSNLYETRPHQPGSPRALVKPGAIRWPLDWSADGRLVLYAQIDPVTKFDLWVVPADGSGEPQPVVVGAGKDNEARFSPDGRFIAYQTDDVKETRVYVTPFPRADRKIPISEGSGGEPRWRKDGRELYYVSQDGALVAVPIEYVDGDLRPGRPVRLFGGRDSQLRVWHFDPAPDGSRFLILPLNETIETTPIHYVTGWQ